mmetsp:Transcript_16014/g.34648  ORF Transcript_16014/g.34648 Transcript_16014/m.34648 type:complete len:186 (-) Transcript_16014:1210-1767(-)|eukprot:CAMPEP_0172300206 /NCGR_PEP_ID=MMETSP1058-20130122/2334_1 /TAXON_ID=83371 /ORGANISM="Detonula confervacea, Strain CCMP 353" /LENGTH=185 /DNA_ID=CAMNT_0013009909 /DNA_START=49 /DNA_END=606 /DNA_ORIENTATION=+
MDDTAIKVPVPATTGKVNPILKKDPHQPSSPSAAAQGDGAEKRHIVWDEHAIEEHDLLRGTRMKIDEPNTPYTHYDHHSDEESNSSGHHPRSPDENQTEDTTPTLATNWNDISSKLQAVADKRDRAPSRDSNMSDSEDEAKKKNHDKKFKDMRKKHYNEADAMKRWKAAHANDDDEDDNDDDMEE